MTKPPKGTNKTPTPKKTAAQKAAPKPVLEVPSEVSQRLDRLEDYIATIAEPIAKLKDPDRSPWARFADRLETSTPSRILVGLGALLTFFSVIGIAATAVGVILQYQSMEEERVARAWQALATKGLGNGGKVGALEFIHSKGEDLSGINIGGTSISTGSQLEALKLSGASIWDSNWDYSTISHSNFENTTIGRMRMTNSRIHGSWKSTNIVWSDFSATDFWLKYDSSMEFDTAVLDKSTFVFDPEEYLHGLVFFPFGTDLTEEEQQQKMQEAEKKWIDMKVAAGVVVSFKNASLRCALIPLEHTVNFSFESSNLSGAYLGDPYSFDPEYPEEAFANLPEEEWKKFEGAWYFSDNPPVGVPEALLLKYFTRVDRTPLKEQCSRFEPRAATENPFALLDGVDGIETACVSLAKMPETCATRYPSMSLFTLETSMNDEFRLPAEPE